MRCTFDRTKRRYDHRKKSANFVEGEFVRHYGPTRRPGIGRKLQLLTDRPYKIVRKLNDVNFVLKRTPKARSFTTHIDRVTKYEREPPQFGENRKIHPVEKMPFPNLPTSLSVARCDIISMETIIYDDCEVTSLGHKHLI